jgi:hypothetical protein
MYFPGVFEKLARVLSHGRCVQCGEIAVVVRRNCVLDRADITFADLGRTDRRVDQGNQVVK